jgi:anti-sigma factor RsiW
MTCHELDRLVTPFIDGECTDEERTAIVGHLRHCQDCRARVEAESTAKHVLHAHATVARTIGVSPSWRPRVFRLGQPTLPVHPKLLVLVAVIGAGLLGVWLRPRPLIAVGVIGDSLCKAEHHRFPNRTGDSECTLGCVNAGAQFVLVTDERVYRIRNQQLPELVAFADQRVRVEGRLDGDRLIVAKMTPFAASRDQPARHPQ